MLRRRLTLLSRKIEDKTVFIVFDMEWNQPFPGRDYKFDVSSLSGEIIEIGAVKYVYDSGILTEKDDGGNEITFSSLGNELSGILISRTHVR